MTNDNDYSKLIEDYLRDGLSAADKSELEKRMAMDPVLKNEFELQSDIIHVIRDSRKAELKTMLTQIHIGWYHLVPTAWKVAAAVTIATVTGLSAFYYLRQNPERKSAPIEKINITRPETKIKEPFPENSVKLQPEKVKEKNSEIKNPSSKGIKINKSESEKLHDNKVNETQVITVPQPGVEEKAGDLPDNTLKTEGAIKIEPAVIENNTAKDMAVKTIISKKYEFHYTFNEGALTLYGNFDGNPYKILEINSKNGKEYYLIYNENFYGLKQNTSAITPLVKVIDKNLVNELEILKNNK